MERHNNTPLKEFNGLFPFDMHNLLHHPFSDQCVVCLSKHDKKQYNLIPLVRQDLVLLRTLVEIELKFTKLEPLPLK